MNTGNTGVDLAYANAKRKHADVDYPQLNLNVHIVGSCFLDGAITLFAKAGCRRAASLEESDLVVYLGGADIDPALYGESALRCTSFSAARDAVEIDVFSEALTNDIPQFGICRGMQFLAAMNGSKLYQDVDNHTSTHNIVDTTGRVLRASSMHHQMVIEDDDMIPLAYAEQKGHGRSYHTFSKLRTDPTHNDLEAAIFPNIGAIGVQGHPEVGGYPEYSAWCLEQVKSFLNDKAMMGHNSRSTAYVLGPNKIALPVDRMDPERLPQSLTAKV
jgi:gamma-glutamyl-gamma-aminobutyrate hydrolase PuuD